MNYGLLLNKTDERKFTWNAWVDFCLPHDNTCFLVKPSRWSTKYLMFTNCLKRMIRSNSSSLRHSWIIQKRLPLEPLKGLWVTPTRFKSNEVNNVITKAGQRGSSSATSRNNEQINISRKEKLIEGVREWMRSVNQKYNSIVNLD
jgi:hypothetical protein